MPRIFISHSSLDKDQAARIKAWLEANGFAHSFLDFDAAAGIPTGADWERTLYRELSAADALILILTSNWLASKWCFVEFAQARALGKAIFPLIETPTGKTIVSPDIQHLNLVEDRAGGLDRLLVDLTAVALNNRGFFPFDRTRPPYPGLLAFDEADAAVYFGRDDEIRRLIERLNARRAQGGEKLVVVLGASGSGKSSLLRAGVVPRLRRDAHNWIVLPAFRPQAYPLDELAQSIATALDAPKSWRDWQIAFSAPDLPHTLTGLYRDLRAQNNQTEAQILLVIDQAEELLTNADPTHTGPFFRVLNALLADDLPFLVALTLRSDYLGRLQQEPALTAPFEQFSLKPLPLERIREIIEGPARIANLTIDDDLTEAARTDASTSDALPLLAFTLRELYDRAASSSHLTLAAYQALGDPAAKLSPLENSVTRKADEVLAAAKPTEADLAALKQAFIPALVRINSDGDYVRRPAPLAALPSAARPLIERLAKARLLTILDDRGATTVEVTHEALLRKWPQLRTWLDEERDFLLGKDQLERDLLDYQRTPAAQQSEALLTGLKLTRARAWLLAKPHQLTQPERDFIQASIARHEADLAQKEATRRRTLRATAAAALILFVVALAAVWQWHQARLQEDQAVSRQLATQSLQDATRNNGQALREAVAAAARAHTEEAELALNTALGQPRLHAILHHDKAVYDARFSPDGTRLVTASVDGSAKVWDSATGALLFTLENGDYAVETAIFSSDGQRIASSSAQDGHVRVWNAQTGKLLAIIPGANDNTMGVPFSPDHQRIITGSVTDDSAHVWNADTGQLIATIPARAPDNRASAVFSTDGRTILLDTTQYDSPHHISLWNAQTVTQTFQFPASNSYTAAAFSPDGTRIAMSIDQLTTQVWETATLKRLPDFDTATGSIREAGWARDRKMLATSDLKAVYVEVEQGTGHATYSWAGTDPTGAAISPDGRLVAVAFSDRVVRLYDTSTDLVIGILNGHTDNVFALSFSPDGTHIATTSSDSTARIWNVADGRLVAALKVPTDPSLRALYSPDGASILTVGETSATLWSSAGNHLLRTFAVSTYLQTADFSADGSHVVTADRSGSTLLWDTASGKNTLTLKADDIPVKAAAFSPDGSLVATFSVPQQTDDDTGTMRVWDAKSGKLLATFPAHINILNHIQFSPDSRRVLVPAEKGEARLYDAHTGSLVLTLATQAGMVNYVAFSPDGQRIVTSCDDNLARLWDARTGKLLFTLAGHTSFLISATFSPDSRTVATASDDHTARLWDVATGKLLFTLAGQDSIVTDVQFSPDSARLATTNHDGHVRLWSVQDGQLIATLASANSYFNAARFSPDGTRLVTALPDGTAAIYAIGFSELLDRARQQLPVTPGN